MTDHIPTEAQDEPLAVAQDVLRGYGHDAIADALAGYTRRPMPSRDRRLNTIRKQISELPVDYGTTRMGEPKVSLNAVLALFKGGEG